MKKIIVLSLAACISNLLFSAAPDIKTITLRSLAGEEWFVETSEATTIGDVALESAARGFCKRPQTEIEDEDGNVIKPATLGEYITITSRGEVLAGDALVSAYVTTAEKDLSGTNLLFNALIGERSPEKGKELLQTIENAALPDADPQQITASALKLIHAGAAINIRISDHTKIFNNETPLHRAISYDLTQIAQALIDAGADVDPHNVKKDPIAPLHCAVRKGITNIAQALIDAAADVDARNWEGLTPLHNAINKGSVQALINAGAGVDTRSGIGSTPLHSARNEEVAQTLLAAGADVDARDLCGATPLYRAVLIRYTDTAKLLLAAGANPHVQRNSNNDRTIILDVNRAHLHWQDIVHILEEDDEKSAEQKPQDEGEPA